MDVFVVAAALFVIVAIAARWPAIRRVASWRRPPSGVLEDTELGFARIGMPAGWRPGRFMNASAALQAIHPVQHRYLIVISESREDFDHTMTLASFAAQTVNTLTGGLRILASRGPIDTEVAGFPARQFELDTLNPGGGLVTYLHTTIEGSRAWHQVVCWATRSRYSRPVFDRMLGGFEEVAGPAPRPFDAGPAPLRLVSSPDKPVRRIGF